MDVRVYAVGIRAGCLERLPEAASHDAQSRLDSEGWTEERSSRRFCRTFGYGLRMLRKSPSFALAAIVTLALGIGVNTAVFSVVNAIVLRPLPVRDGDRIVVIASQRSSSRTLRGVSFEDLQDYRRASVDLFEDIAGYSVGFLGLAPIGSAPQRVLVTWVTGNYFSLLDIRPTLGRLIRIDEGTPGRIDPVVVLGTQPGSADSGAIHRSSVEA